MRVGRARSQGRRNGRPEGEDSIVPDMTHLGTTAEEKTDGAATWHGEDDRTAAIGEGLAAIAHALLEVAEAIRENTAACNQQ